MHGVTKSQTRLSAHTHTHTHTHEGHLSCLSTTALDPFVLGAGIPGHPPLLRELKNSLFPVTLVAECPIQSKAVWK